MSILSLLVYYVAADSSATGMQFREELDTPKRCFSTPVDKRRDVAGPETIIDIDDANV